MPSANRSPSGAVMEPPTELRSGRETLSVARCREIHQRMVLTRKLDERCIKMSKSGEAYFWVGGPGEEAFNVCLGLQVLKGRGPAYDFLHLHYRNLGVLVGMGMPVLDHIRQMAMTLTDPHSMGRNFVCHYSIRDWNVIPVTSVIEVQYVMAPGSALVQKRHGGEGVSIVIGGDAGTHEGDFASSMIWSSRPDCELPVLILVTNNDWGISTTFESQHAEKSITDRGKAFGIEGEVVDGNDAIASWHALARGFRHCRTRRKPYMIEARVSRLHGHSSSSGAGRVKEEIDPLAELERKLLDAGVMEAHEIAAIHNAAAEEIEEAVRQAHTEPRPTAADVYTHTYAPSPVDCVYPEDYTGLPS
jgi:2-oxoisovalerate dehydrogenase E1 component alpha subunit